MDALPEEKIGRDLSPQLVSILTSEHYNLQNGRANTISDASGRANLFISAVSTTLVALAFIGQASNFGNAFFTFSFILFPTLYFLGMVTFERTLQSTIEDIVYARGMSRLRHLFLEHAPDMKPYFILSSSDDTFATLRKTSMGANFWQILLGTAGTIAIITSVIAGTIAGLAFERIFSRPDFSGLLPLSVCVGIICFLANAGFSLLYHWRKINREVQSLPTLFSSSTKE